MSDYDMSIHFNPDAAAWAKFFIDRLLKHGKPVDEEMMIGWFANAMMAQHDFIVPKVTRQARAEGLREAAALAYNRQMSEKQHKDEAIRHSDELDIEAFGRGEFIMKNLHAELLSRADAIERGEA